MSDLIPLDQSSTWHHLRASPVPPCAFLCSKPLVNAMECYDIGHTLEHLSGSYVLCDFIFLHLYFTVSKEKAWMIDEKPLCIKGKTGSETKRRRMDTKDWRFRISEKWKCYKKRNWKTACKIRTDELNQEKYFKYLYLVTGTRKNRQNYNALLYIMNNCLKLMQSFGETSYLLKRRLWKVERHTLALHL